jgi:hypothetical protein
METINKIINWSTILTNSQVSEICHELTSFSFDTENNLIDIVGHDITKQIITIINIERDIKHNDFKNFLKAPGNIQIQLTCIEDWKSNNKLKLIKLLIGLDYLDKHVLMRLIGNQSKKTYSSGQIINYTNLTIKKIFDKNFNNFIDNFYLRFEAIRLELTKLGFDKDIISNTFREMVDLMQGHVICSEMFQNNELDGYKKQIADIIVTRDKEEQLFMLYYKIYFNRLVSLPGNSPLKYILNNSWNETKIKYLWLTNLITFINNGSENCKKYLIEHYGIKKFEGSGYGSKCFLIREVIKKFNLSYKNSNEIIDFIFSIGTYFKHGTYFKWYYKQMKRIEIFEQYSSNTFDENLILLVSNVTTNIDIPEIIQLIELVKEYYTYLKAL